MDCSSPACGVSNERWSAVKRTHERSKTSRDSLGSHLSVANCGFDLFQLDASSRQKCWTFLSVFAAILRTYVHEGRDLGGQHKMALAVSAAEAIEGGAICRNTVHSLRRCFTSPDAKKA